MNNTVRELRMQGTLSKMRSRVNSVIEYELPVGDESLPLNPLIGKPLSLHYTGNIYCDACGRKTNKSFAQGHCFPCMKNLARCDMCVMKPETCHYHLGTCREPEWGDTHCMINHVVYLANTSGLKVGITRENQVPTRWVDQGATQALPIYRVGTRQLSGFIEVALAEHIADKTNWRALLKGDNDPIDLVAKSEELDQFVAPRIGELKDEYGEESITRVHESVLSLSYPVTNYPEKIKSFNFDKNPEVSGTLTGIKGQYLIFDEGVINVRKFTGYEIEVTH